MSPYYQKLRNLLGNELILIPAVAAVIHDEKHRLLLQEKHDGSWSLPAGAIEPGESPEAAVIREIQEETGLVCTVSRIIAVLGGIDFRYTYPNADQVEYVITLFECTATVAGAILDTAETKSIRYFSRDEMPGLALPYDLHLLFS